MLYALTDHLGTVRDLVDENQTVRKHTKFDSFGQITGETYYDKQGNAVTAAHAEAVAQLFGYTGHPLDESTGLNVTQYRHYDPTVGQWLSTDPTGFDAGDANLYRYVGNKVAGYVDPDGLEELVVGGPERFDEVLSFDDWRYWRQNPHGVPSGGYMQLTEETLKEYQEYVDRKNAEICDKMYDGPAFRASEFSFENEVHEEAVEALYQLKDLVSRYRGRGRLDETESDKLEELLRAFYGKDKKWALVEPSAELSLQFRLARKAIDELAARRRWDNHLALTEACGDVMQGLAGPTLEEVARRQAALYELTAPERQRQEWLDKELLRLIYKTLRGRPQPPVRK